MTELEKQAMELYSFPEARKAYIKGFQDANKWISVSEQMPTINTEVLVNVENIGVTVLMWNGIKWIFPFPVNVEVVSKVSHWQPLPSTDSINLK